MTKEIRPAPATDITPARVDELPANATMTQFLAAALLDERVSVDKMRELYAFHRQIKKDDAEEQFDAAMSRLQAKLPVIPKTRTIEVKGKIRSRFAAIEDIDAICKPLYTAEGFGVDYDTDIQGEGKVGVIIYVSRGGFSKTRRVILPLDKSEYRNAVQNYGATISYARRYAFSLAFNIITGGEDNDAHAVSTIIEEEQRNIEDLIAECGLKPEAISKFLQILDVKSIGDITRGKHYQTAINYLVAKRDQLGRK